MRPPCSPRTALAANALALIAALVTATFATPALAGDTGLIAFEMSDQFDEVHTDAEMRGGVLIVLGSDKAGSEYNPGWRRAIEEALDGEGVRDGVLVYDVANLRSAPKFIKGMVKKKFPDDPAQPALFDWKGQFAATYGFEGKKCNIAVFDHGTLVHQVPVQEVEPATLRQVVTLVAERVAAGGPAAP